MEWFISDTHFGHERILELCPKTRGKFDSISNHDAHIIRAWNSNIAPSDKVYHLGDFSFHNIGYTRDNILPLLNGDITFIRGNHDRSRMVKLLERDHEVYDYLKLNIEGQKIILSHYPIHEWDGKRKGSIHVHGHVHCSRMKYKKNRINVAYDANQTPISFYEIMRYVKDKNFIQRFFGLI